MQSPQVRKVPRLSAPPKSGPSTRVRDVEANVFRGPFLVLSFATAANPLGASEALSKVAA